MPRPEHDYLGSELPKDGLVAWQLVAKPCHPIHNILFDHSSRTCSARAKCRVQGERVNMLD